MGPWSSHHEITYLRPVVYHPEPLRLELWIDQIRGADFIVRYEVFDGDDAGRDRVDHGWSPSTSPPTGRAG